MEVNNENENNDETMDPNINMNSWIFMENDETDEATEFCFKNKERVEEVTETDLKSISSDSDGISVISESEETQPQDECCTCLSKTKGNEVIDKNNIDTDENSDDNYADADCIENVSSKDSVVKNNIIFLTTMTGICLVAVYILWPKPTQEYISIDISSEHDNDYQDITDFIDEYDTEILMHYSNNTCDSDFFYKKLDTIVASNLNEINNTKNDTFVSIEPTKFQDFTNEKKQKKYKHEKTTENKPLNKITKTLKSKESYLYKKDKYLIKKEKYLKELEKELHKLEAKLRKTYRQIKKDKDNKKNKFNTKKQQNITGDWYHNMYFSRSEIRYKEKLSEWIFDRSKMRNQLREKESWHFSHSRGREQFRANEKFRPKKIIKHT